MKIWITIEQISPSQWIGEERGASKAKIRSLGRYTLMTSDHLILTTSSPSQDTSPDAPLPLPQVCGLTWKVIKGSLFLIFGGFHIDAQAHEVLKEWILRGGCI